MPHDLYPHAGLGVGMLPSFARALMRAYVASETVALQWRHTNAGFSISPAQGGQVFVCHQARLDGAGVAVLMGRTDQTSAAIQPRIIHPGSQFSATIGFQSG